MTSLAVLIQEHTLSLHVLLDLTKVVAQEAAAEVILTKYLSLLQENLALLLRNQVEDSKNLL